MVTYSTIHIILFVAGLLLSATGLIKRSSPMVILGLVVAFLGAFYIFKLYNYPVFKAMKMTLDAILGPFKF